MGFIPTQTPLLSVFQFFFFFFMSKFGTSLLLVESYLKTCSLNVRKDRSWDSLQVVANLIMNTLVSRLTWPQVLGEVVLSVQGIVSTGQSF